MDDFNSLPGAYFLIINIISFFTAGYDKMKAKSHGWRVPERRLFLLAFLGGAIGVYAGMKVFRHKTKHRLFTMGIPSLIIVNLASFYLLFMN